MQLPSPSSSPIKSRNNAAASAASAGSILRPKMRAATQLNAGNDLSDSLINRLRKPENPALTSRRDILGGVAGLFTGCACSLCGVQPAQASAGWGYGNQAVLMDRPGTSLWGGVCSVGSEQSPVDIKLKEKFGRTTAPKLDEGKITCMYNVTENCTVSNTGHGSMQVAFPAGNRITIGNKYLELLQFHFHTPSEHAMDGRRFPMEVHLVHKDLYTNDLTVLGVMLERSRGTPENACVRLALDCAPELNEPPVSNKFTTFDPNMLLPKSMRNGKGSYVNYSGSLTTPPCSEKVNWYVFTDTLKVTDTEIVDFQEYAGAGVTLGMNSRPVQVMNERKFTYYDGEL